MKDSAVALLPMLLSAIVLACRDSTPTDMRSSGSPNLDVADDTGPGSCVQPARQCHFNTRGEAANVNWFEEGGEVVRYGFVTVARGGSQNTPQAFLEYLVNECDPSFTFCTVVRGGFGTISVDDVTGNSKGLHLRTNTTDNASFFTYAGPAGTIEVDWVNNGLIEQRFSGTVQRDQPGFHEHTTGQSLDVSANASGTIVGLTILSTNFAQISTAHSVQIDVNR